jgi:hypothetical protein
MTLVIRTPPRLPHTTTPVRTTGSGAVASFLCVPTDLMKVRLQVDGMYGAWCCTMDSALVQEPFR